MTAAVTTEAAAIKELRRIADVMRSGATGPLRIAHEAIGVANAWDPKSNGIGAAAAFKRHTGKDVAYFQRAADAVDALGRHVMNWMAHDLAIYIAHSVSDEIGRKRATEGLAVAFADVRKRGLPVTKRIARAELFKLLGKTGRPAGAACASCARLREECARLTAELETMRSAGNE